MRHRLLQSPIFPIILALSSAACSAPGDGRKSHDSESAPTASVSAPGRAPAPMVAKKDARAVHFTDNATGQGDGAAKATRKFSYSWPAAVSAVPGLVALLTGEREKALASQKAQWAQVLDTASSDCPACRSFETVEKWQVVADLPQWLSLSDTIYTYKGGAHGMTGLRSLVWDKHAGRAIEGKDLFRSPEALERALGSRLCARLDKARAKKRGEPIPSLKGADDFLNGCPHLDQATILVGSARGEKFDRVGIWFGPYAAGPYAEGSYELNFPLDAAVIDAVKPEYAVAFTIER